MLFPRGPLWYQLAVVLFDCGHLCFRNFNSIVPINVVRLKSYVIVRLHCIISFYKFKQMFHAKMTKMCLTLTEINKIQ